jgi:hypothetical protein
VPAGDDEDRERKRNPAVIQKDRFDVAGEVMDGDDRLAEHRGRRLREGHADQQRANQPRALSDRDRVDVAPARTGVLEGLLDDPADIAHMLPRRKLRNYAAPFAMDRDLRRDDIGTDTPRLAGVARGFHDRCRGFVAGGLDAEDAHPFGLGFGLWALGFRETTPSSSRKMVRGRCRAR